MASGAKPKIIGLAGGIGSGKSQAAAILASLGCVVCDSDALARAALELPSVRDELVRWWGAGVLDGQGRVDRRRVAERVFSDPGERRRLEGVVHPIIKERRREAVAEATARAALAVVIDAPLLFEAGVDQECDAVIFVDAPRERRLARVKATRGWDEGELDRREAAQMPVEEKRRRSTVVVNNHGDRADLERELRSVLHAILTNPRRE